MKRVGDGGLCYSPVARSHTSSRANKAMTTAIAGRAMAGPLPMKLFRSQPVACDVEHPCDKAQYRKHLPVRGENGKSRQVGREVDRPRRALGVSHSAL